MIVKGAGDDADDGYYDGKNVETIMAGARFLLQLLQVGCTARHNTTQPGTTQPGTTQLGTARTHCQCKCTQVDLIHAPNAVAKEAEAVHGNALVHVDADGVASREPEQPQSVPAAQLKQATTRTVASASARAFASASARAFSSASACAFASTSTRDVAASSAFASASAWTFAMVLRIPSTSDFRLRISSRRAAASASWACHCVAARPASLAFNAVYACAFAYQCLACSKLPSARLAALSSRRRSTLGSAQTLQQGERKVECRAPVSKPTC
jgi:hypothetical protein